MTVIIASSKLGIMVADSLLVDMVSKCIMESVRKIIKAPCGTLIGAAGDWGASLAIQRWAMAGFDKPPPAAVFRRVQVVILRPDRTIQVYDDHCYPYEVVGETVVVGTGAVAALAVLSIGGSPLDAVRAACNICTTCGGEPYMLRLED